MINIKDFFNKPQSFLFFLMVFFLISPGMVYLFLWHKELFIQLDWIKLIILSASILIPVSFINTFAQLAFEKAQPTRNGNELVHSFIPTSIFSGLAFFFTILFAFFSSINLLVCLIIAEFFLLFFLFINRNH